MLATPDPAPTGLITALLGRARTPASEITASIGPSPRQMRELTEGRGLFSPLKLRRVAELTRVPEAAILDALERVPEMIDAVGARVGAVLDHPRLGPCEVVSGETSLTVRTGTGALIEGVHPVSFAGPDLLDRFGLTPETDPSDGAVPPREEPATEPEPVASQDGSAPEEDRTNSVVKETLTAPDEPDAEPATESPEESVSQGDAGAAEDPRSLVRDLVEGSGRSLSSLSRALGKDPSFLHGILKRGRGVPEDLVDRLTRVLAETGGADRPPAPRATEEAEPTDPAPENGVGEEVSGEAARAEADTPEARAEDRVILLRPTPPGPEAEMMEVVIEGVCRVRVPAGYDMEAAARLIRSVSAGLPAMSRSS